MLVGLFGLKPESWNKNWTRIRKEPMRIWFKSVLKCGSVLLRAFFNIYPNYTTSTEAISRGISFGMVLGSE